MEYKIKTLIAEIDCTAAYPEDRYFEHGAVKVTESAAGRYREAEGVPLSRFGYRFKVQNPGKPHLALVTYPDDKRRYICMMDGTSYDLTTGIVTGFAFPLSGEMQTAEQVFWPRWHDGSIVFMTWGHGEPAAVSAVKIYELEDLPAAEMPAIAGRADRRQLGIQYEDPCGTGASEGAQTREQWLSHVVEYAKFTGQNIFTYPINWYHGPLFPSETQDANGFDWVIASDRKQYTRWTTEPGDWYADMLKVFEREGLQYVGSMTLMRLSGLIKGMNTDIEAIKGGADTYNNIVFDDTVQQTPKDWTAIYNVRNFDLAVEYHEQGKDFRDFPWAYGEKSRTSIAGPMFNPLHPTVQTALIEYFGEIAARYGRSPAFAGLSINIWHATIVWFGSLRSGYDDYTVGLFKKETGINVPGDPAAPDRFSRRYRYINHFCRRAWIDWRCRKIRDLIVRLRDEIQKYDPKLKLLLTLWWETNLPQVLGEVGPAFQLYARDNGYEYFKNGGVDLKLFKDIPGIEVDVEIQPTRDRGWNFEGAKNPPEKTCSFRDHDYLDVAMNRHMHDLTASGDFIFNSWVEAWGKHKWFKVDPADPNLAAVCEMDGKPAEGIFGLNSEYPEDGFWHDSQMRITPAHPAGPHFPESYAHALAEHDSLRITRGGLFLDKAHSGQIREFATAFRTLPAVKFEPAKHEHSNAHGDPVTVRFGRFDGVMYFYAVNREYREAKVKIEFDWPVEPADAVTGQKFHGSPVFKFELGPYGLKVFTVPIDAEIKGYSAKLPEDFTAALEKGAEKALEAITAVQAGDLDLPGLAETAADINRCLAEKRYSRLRHILTSYIVLKCAELTASTGD